MTRYIIIAAGEETRWKNYMGTPKHFASLNGEPIIERTTRLLKERGVSKHDIYVISKNYKLKNVINKHPKLNPNNYDADKFLSSSQYWCKKGRTVILYGDVYFSEEAIDIITEDKHLFWRLYCRPTPSKITGTPWGECFAVSFYPYDHALCKARLNLLISLYEYKFLDRIGGWEWARVMAGENIENLKKHHEWLIVYRSIDDETDDLDYPSDYDRMKKVLENGDNND